MDAGGRGLASLVTDTLRLERDISWVEQEEGTWMAPEKRVAVFSILYKELSALMLLDCEVSSGRARTLLRLCIRDSASGLQWIKQGSVGWPAGLIPFL